VLNWRSDSSMGAAVGNLVDRIRSGYVVTFFDLSVWPSSMWRIGDLCRRGLLAWTCCFREPMPNGRPRLKRQPCGARWGGTTGCDPSTPSTLRPPLPTGRLLTRVVGQRSRASGSADRVGRGAAARQPPGQPAVADTTCQGLPTPEHVALRSAADLPLNIVYETAGCRPRQGTRDGGPPGSRHERARWSTAAAGALPELADRPVTSVRASCTAETKTPSVCW